MAEPADARTDAQRWGWRVALAWVLAYAAVIVVVSLLPSHLRFDARGVARQLLKLRRSLTMNVLQLHNVRDLATNFVLYLPLGALVAAVAPLRGRGRWIGLLAGAALSTTMEAAQIVTNRFPSIWDLAMNGAGHAAGFLLVMRARAAGDFTVAIFVGRHDGSTRQRLAAGLRNVYLPALVLLALLPLHISVSPSDLWTKLGDHSIGGGRVWLSPLGPWPDARLFGLATSAALLLPYGFLSAVAFPERGRRAYVRYAVLAGLISLGIELAQLVVLERSTDVLQPFAAAIGALVGVAMARLWDRAARAHDPGTRAFALADGLLLALAGYAVVLIAVAWSPFAFVGSWQQAAYNLVHETAWVPLTAYAEAERSLATWRDVGHEVGWYVPLGMLLEAYLLRLRWSPRLPRRIVFALGLALALGTVLELGQGAIVGRFADSTDIISHVLGAAIGYLLLSALERRAVGDAAPSR